MLGQRRRLQDDIDSALDVRRFSRTQRFQEDTITKTQNWLGTPKFPSRLVDIEKRRLEMEKREQRLNNMLFLPGIGKLVSDIKEYEKYEKQLKREKQTKLEIFANARKLFAEVMKNPNLFVQLHKAETTMLTTTSRANFFDRQGTKVPDPAATRKSQLPSVATPIHARKPEPVAESNAVDSLEDIQRAIRKAEEDRKKREEQKKKDQSTSSVLNNAFSR